MSIQHEHNKYSPIPHKDGQRVSLQLQATRCAERHLYNIDSFEKLSQPMRNNIVRATAKVFLAGRSVGMQKTK